MNVLRAAGTGGLACQLSRSGMLSRGFITLCLFSLLQKIPAEDTRGVALIAPDPVTISQPARHGKDYALIFATDEYNDPEWKHLSN
ncbi:MAG: hypothetical protein JF609_03640, partial [Verrucomicrobia bacterium]|nr:hypothetical protein [Verrucomicrobiota bacterium]